jgi:hypothetical protein
MRPLKNFVGSPALWGIAYLSLIPLFAGIYAAQGAGSFHDSNIAHEEGRAQDIMHLRQALTTAISTRLPHHHWHEGGMQFSIASVAVERLKLGRHGRIILQVTGSFHSVGRPTVPGGFSELIAMYLNPIGVSASAAGTDFGLSVVLLNRFAPSNGEMVPFFPYAPPLRALFQSFQKQPFLTVPGRTYELLSHIYYGKSGDPAYVSGGWWRMVYLSAVTVTTLGFGDITPVSQTARLFVALEAVLGVVLIGVFLSRLAIRVRAQR